MQQRSRGAAVRHAQRRRHLAAVAALVSAAVLATAAVAPAGPPGGGAGAAGTAGTAAAGERGLLPGLGGGRLRVLAGVLRQDRPGSGWYLVGGAHLVLGLEVVSADREQIVLRFPPARRVVSVLCGPDETYAPLGYTCGASVALDRVTVRLGRGGRLADPTATSAGPYANFWLLGLVEGFSGR
ncbi:hypothetical protein ACFVVX_11275 [Kitasatospora sp. NPDC058170]|uniref:hypothetical protein n=1 Tax=Kitasatospora sp. NPDC058170 TaxID=3346364 RepID=UPI0036DEB95D